MFQKSILPLALILVVYGGTVAHACRCPPPPAPKKALEKASAVFSGKVASVEKRGQSYRVTITVERSWKGPLERQLVVTTSVSGAECGYGFAEGQSYLVYCTGGGKGLRTNLCTRTRGLEDAKRDLADLGEGKKPASE